MKWIFGVAALISYFGCYVTEPKIVTSELQYMLTAIKFYIDQCVFILVSFMCYLNEKLK